MKKILVISGLYVLIIALTYFWISFFALNFNIYQWSEGERGIMIAVSVTYLFLSPIIVSIMEDDMPF